MRIKYIKNDDGIIIVRMYGDRPTVDIPSFVDGERVTGLGEYCFSDKEPVYDEACIYQGYSDGKQDEDVGAGCYERVLSGDYITKVSIPHMVRSIGDLCFYGCGSLKEIELYRQDMEDGSRLDAGSDTHGLSVGSDIFMNCHRLSLFILHKSVSEKTILKRILMQKNTATYVRFDDAEAYFPEYTEYYDLIGPAHIFELAIDGEGLRVRQCFEDEIFRSDAYDDAFRRASAGEDERILCRMAAARLQFPEHLPGEARSMYESYLAGHIEALAADAVKDRDLTTILALAKQGELTGQQIRQCLILTTKEGWAEGTRMLLGVLSPEN